MQNHANMFILCSFLLIHCAQVESDTTCIVIQAHLPDFYNPPPLDADSVSRVSEIYGITMDAALYRLFFTPSPHSRRFDTKDIEAPHSRSCAAALCWQERV